eukprot:Blabericola_migrator_1__152@NODE_103_length_14287_cov_84_885584_g91_i0_p2_GENE_NODE_103_length_14287_cov_84_885584_g91_i0NODE_103_length_14287_cov_84_885584_g91_i0_p2_ORF_typecomplete_len918_score182_40_NODE_103_length_14287_cov_84_885584_g91_i01109813851
MSSSDLGSAASANSSEVGSPTASPSKQKSGLTQSDASPSLPAHSGSMALSPRASDIPPSPTISKQASSNLPPSASPSAPVVNPHSLAAVDLLPTDKDEGVDAWPCAHCLTKQVAFKKWKEGQDENRKEAAQRRFREFLLKLPEFRAAFPLDKSRFPISRKFGLRCREVYKACHKDWLYLHERKPGLRPPDPDMGSPLNTYDFRFSRESLDTISPGQTSAQSGNSPPAKLPSEISKDEIPPLPQVVQCAVAKDRHERVPIYISQASSSGSASSREKSPKGDGLKRISKNVGKQVSPRPSTHTKTTSSPKPTKPSKLADVKLTSTKSPVKDVDQRAASSMTSSSASRTPSPNLLAPPTPSTRKKHKIEKTEGNKEGVQAKPKRSKSKKKKKTYNHQVPNRWPDCCKAAECSEALGCMCEDYEWANRHGRNRAPMPQCSCEYYEMLKEVYDLLDEERRRKANAKERKKQKKAMENKIRCDVLKQERAARLKAKRQKTLLIRTKKDHRPLPWEHLAREAMIAQSRFENPAFKAGNAGPHAPLPPVENHDMVSSTLKELSILIKEQANRPVPPPVVLPPPPPPEPRKEPPKPRPHLSTSNAIFISEAPPPPPPPPPAPVYVEPEVEESSPPMTDLEPEISGVDYIVGGTKVEVPMPPPPEPLPPQRVMERPSPPQRVMERPSPPPPPPPQPRPIAQPRKQVGGWKVKGGGGGGPTHTEVYDRKDFKTPQGQPIPFINYKLVPGGPKQAFTTAARHGRTPTVMPESTQTTPGYLPEDKPEQPSTVVELSAHPHVPYNVPFLQVGNSKKTVEADSGCTPDRRANAFVTVSPPTTQMLQQRELATLPLQENAFKTVDQMHGSVGGWDAPSTPSMTPADTKSEIEHNYFHPNNEFFYLKNIGQGLKFYRRQEFLSHERGKRLRRFG